MSKKDDSHLSLVKNQTDLSNPMEILELLKNAITRKQVNNEELKQAVRQVLTNFEMQNRLFMIAAANAELPRIIRLLNFITDAEEELFTQDRIESATNRELAKMYALAQGNLMSSLDNVKRVADMRIEAIRAAGGVEAAAKLLDPSSESELNELAGLPALDSQGRDKVRKLVSGLVDAIDKDRSVTEDTVDDSFEFDSDD